MTTIIPIEKIRQKTALSIAVMVALSLVFSMLMLHEASVVSDKTEALRQHELEALEDFKQLALLIDRTTLDAFERSWYDLAGKGYDGEVLKRAFIRKQENLLPSIILSVIVTEKDGAVTMLYEKEEYEKMEDRILAYIESGFVKPGVNIIGDGDIPFGEGDRLFLSGRKLYSPCGSAVVYVGFDEQIRFSDFINASDSELLASTRQSTVRMVRMVQVFSTLVVIYGFVLMILFRKFSIESLQTYVGCMQAGLLKEGLFGDVAVKLGYLTPSQVETCLEEQIREREGAE